MKLSYHSIPLYDHIVPQISKFHSAIKNHATRSKLIDAFDEEIETDPNLNYKYKTIGIKKERYKLLTDVINEKPEIVIIIDKKIGELEDICDSLPFASKVIEFKTHKREGSNVTIHIFDVLVSYPSEPEEEESPVEIPVITKPPRRHETLNQILEVAKLVLRQGKSYNEAVKIVAREKKVHEATVRDKTTRRINLNTDQFQELLQDKRELINFLIERFPDKKQIIDETLK